MVTTRTKLNLNHEFLMLTYSMILSLVLISRLRQQGCFYVILVSFPPTHSFCLAVPWWSNIRYFDSHQTLHILEFHHPCFVSMWHTWVEWILFFWLFWKEYCPCEFSGASVLYVSTCRVLFIYTKIEKYVWKMGTTLGGGYTLGILV
jgi:hypothetical protein